MAAVPKLDSAGVAKLKALDEAILLLQRIHGLVENYAIAVKSNKPTGQLVMSIRRTLPSLAANLKSQFGLIADQVLAVNLSASRGASEAVRLRALREGVALIKQALEIALVQTKVRHTDKGESDDKRSSGDGS